jgi:hypothetical protein
MALSDDPVRREAQLANLQAGAPLGNPRTRRHGGYATHKTLPADSVAAAIYAELEQETPLRDGDGGLPVVTVRGGAVGDLSCAAGEYR